MSKLRLKIYPYDIIAKKIISVQIDDILLLKENFTLNSKVTQYFYNFIKRNINRNINRVTFISYKEHNDEEQVVYLYIKEGLLHSFDNEAYRIILNDKIISGYYFVNGHKIKYDDWLKFSRREKLKNLIN